MNIFFNFRPIMMIQNENLLYNDERIYLLHHHTRARACARQKSIKLDYFTKKSFFRPPPSRENECHKRKISVTKFASKCHKL
eukprot:UN01256